MMDIYKYIIASMVFIMLATNDMFAQNYVVNGDFQTADAGQIPLCLYDVSGVFESTIYNWVPTWYGTVHISTPDWIPFPPDPPSTCDDGNYILNNFEGNRYVHFVGTEGIKANLSTNLVKDTTYQLKFDWAASGEITVDFILSPYLSGYWIDQKNILTFTTSGTPQNVFWQTYSTTFSLNSNKYDNIIIKSFEDNSHNYYIDNVYIGLPIETCPSVLLIENVSYNYVFPVFEAGKIIAGSSVDPNQIDGPVIVKDGAYVEFKAEEEVLLEDGFVVEPGGEFLAHIVPCGSPCDFPPVPNAGNDNEYCDGSETVIGMSPPPGSYSVTWTAEPTSALEYLSNTGITNPIFNPPPDLCGSAVYTLHLSNYCTTLSDQVTIWYGIPTYQPPYLTLSNIFMNNCDISFDVNVGPCNKNVTIELFSSSDNFQLPLSSWIYECGADFPCCSFHWVIPDNTSMCQDYQLRVTAQDICNNQSAVQTIYWPRIHNVNVIQISNVVTNNDDGFNECWEAIVEGAEYYEYVIYDLYGDILYHVTNSIHCPDQNIVTLWCPEDYPEEGSQVFWYVISFWNSCGSSETHQGTIEYFNMLKTPVSDMMQNSDLTHQGKLHVSQNPNSANVYVNCPENLQKITSIDIYNATGQLVRSETDYSLEILNKATIILNTTKLSPGIYFIRLTTTTDIQTGRFIVVH